MIWTQFSENAHLCRVYVTLLLGRDVEEVKHTIVAHHRQSIVLFVEGDRLEPLVYLNLRQTQIAVEVLAHHFQERQSKRNRTTN